MSYTFFAVLSHCYQSSINAFRISGSAYQNSDSMEWLKRKQGHFKTLDVLYGNFFKTHSFQILHGDFSLYFITFFLLLFDILKFYTNKLTM